MSTHRYTGYLLRVTTNYDGSVSTDELMRFDNAHGYEVGPALKALHKKVHESPPPVVLDGQEPML